GKAAAVRRKCAGISTWRRQRLSHTTLDVDAPEPEVRMGYGIAVGSKDHSATIRSPSSDDVQTRMISQAPGLAARNGNHIHIRVAGYSAGVGNKRSIRGKVGIGFDIRGRGQPAGLAAIARYNPQVARVLKNDQIATH